MTDFAGESFRLRATQVKDFDGTLLLPADLTAATAEIFNGDYTVVVVAPTPLAYDGNSSWSYVWNTTGVASGLYWGRLKFTTTGGVISFEDECIRLTRDPSAP